MIMPTFAPHRAKSLFLHLTASGRCRQHEESRIESSSKTAATKMSAERRRVIPMITREASCSCGQLQIVCQDDPVRISMCLCLACQRRTGSTFGVQAWYRRAQVRPPFGFAKRYVRRADSGRTVTFSFCPEYGGTVFWAAERNPDLIAVAGGTFGDPDFEQPREECTRGQLQ